MNGTRIKKRPRVKGRETNEREENMKVWKKEKLKMQGRATKKTVMRQKKKKERELRIQGRNYEQK